MRQGDQISPKLFMALSEYMYMKLDSKKSLELNCKYLSRLNFADDILLFANKLNDLEEIINKITDCSTEK